MRKNFYAAMVIFLMFCIGKNDLIGQDIHYSQFYNSPLNINPALTGIFNGDVRVIGSFRDQWRNVEVPYTTFTGNYDMKLYTKNRDKGFFGVGAIFNYDQSGDANYNLTDLNLTGSYSRIINKNNIVTAGILLGVASEGYSADGLRWDSQWTGAEFDPTLPSNENFNTDRFTYLETGIGLNYRYQKSARTNFNLGVGLWHLDKPSSTFDNITSELPRRLAINFTGTFKVANPLDLGLHANYYDQGPYAETVVGGLVRYHLNQKAGKKYAIDLGVNYRLGSSLIPLAALHFNQWYVGASYDLNLTHFQDLHDLRAGGPEVHIRYIITNVQPLSEKKACPIF